VDQKVDTYNGLSGLKSYCNGFRLRVRKISLKLDDFIG
jgi:hypothetical protein